MKQNLKQELLGLSVTVQMGYKVYLNLVHIFIEEIQTDLQVMPKSYKHYMWYLQCQSHCQ